MRGREGEKKVNISYSIRGLLTRENSTCGEKGLGKKR